ncbi:MAG: ABC transporter permease [Gammaproteobacteria bacterium]|nr:ABC transporter permease [Gammaproteobacteria bacterium]MCY4357800.1 ABC transporter permease [Gammaproteobacteria bacterium]
MFEVALSSLWSRRGSVVLTLASLTISMAIVIGVEHVRAQAESSFVRTVSEVDLLVGARTSQVNLLLYSVFRIGNATNNIQWQSYQDIISRPGIAWSIPFSLGDSHRGYRVLGTNNDYFEYFRYGDSEPLRLTSGEAFNSPLHAVIGSEVANTLGYETGAEIIIAHGLGNTSFVNHDNLPFTVSGILAPTGTPVDRTIHVSLQGYEAIHLGFRDGVQVAALSPQADDPALAELQPTQITAILLGLETPMAVFALQRAINNYPAEPLTAILPAVALGELWQIIGTLENLLQVISILVLTASLLGLSTMLLSSLRERRRELALYRAIGARPSFIVWLIELEGLAMMAVAAVCGYLLVVLGFGLTQGWLSETYALVIEAWPSSPGIWLYMGGAMLAAILLSLIPALVAYSRSLGQSLLSQ